MHIIDGRSQTKGCDKLDEKKIRMPLWIYPSTQAKVDENMHFDNCKSKSEFIEKAIIFYSGYIQSDRNNEYFGKAITSTVSGIILDTENNLSKILFKLAVEISMMMNVLASQVEIDNNTLRKLRVKCISDIKESIGKLKFEDIVEYQNNK